MNFFDAIRHTLLQQPKQVFLVWPSVGGGQLAPVSHTGRDILNRTQAIREALQAKHIKAGDLVLLALPVSFDLICGLLAVMALGGIPVLPPAGASSVSLLSFVRRARIHMVLAQQPLRPAARLIAWLLKVQVQALAFLPGPAHESAAAEAVGQGQLALVSHSSGSTGKPKAIRRSHQVLKAQHEAIKAIFLPWAGQRDFPLFPNILLHNLAAGVTSILPNVPWGNMEQLSAARVVAQLGQERVHTLTGNVFYFNALAKYLRQYPQDLPTVKAIGIGGSPVPETLVQALREVFPQAAIHIIYGSSEAEPIAARAVGTGAANPLAGYWVGAIHPALEWQICPMGQLSLGAKLDTVVGEIQVRGSHVASAEPGQWLATGDYGYVADGQLYLTGRQGNERIHQGVQHYQLEHLLYHLPGVERVAARSDEAGFTLFIQGAVRRQEVEELIAKTFHGALVCAIHFRSVLPVDTRHLSKILYSQLS